MALLRPELSEGTLRSTQGWHAAPDGGLAVTLASADSGPPGPEAHEWHSAFIEAAGWLLLRTVPNAKRTPRNQSRAGSYRGSSKDATRCEAMFQHRKTVRSFELKVSTLTVL